MNKRLGLYIVLGIAAFLAILFYLTMSGRQNRVEVCITFNGRTACKIASGPTREEAIRTASDNACALIASGVTDSMACARTVPDTIRRLE